MDPPFPDFVEHFIDSDGFQLVPLIVRLCVKVIEAHGLDTVGIYRIPGNVVAVNTLLDNLEKGFEQVDFSDPRWKDVNVVSSLLKGVFRRLEDPLLTDEYYPSFIDASRISNHSNRMKKLRSLLLHKLPKHNYETLKFLCFHLRKVADRSHINKMEPRNLALMFGPSVVRPSGDNMSALVSHMPDQCKITESFILYVSDSTKAQSDGQTFSFRTECNYLFDDNGDDNVPEEVQKVQNDSSSCIIKTPSYSDISDLLKRAKKAEQVQEDKQQQQHNDISNSIVLRSLFNMTGRGGNVGGCWSHFSPPQNNASNSRQRVKQQQYKRGASASDGPLIRPTIFFDYYDDSTQKVKFDERDIDAEIAKSSPPTMVGENYEKGVVVVDQILVGKATMVGTRKQNNSIKPNGTKTVNNNHSPSPKDFEDLQSETNSFLNRSESQASSSSIKSTATTSAGSRSPQYEYPNRRFDGTNSCFSSFNIAAAGVVVMRQQQQNPINQTPNAITTHHNITRQRQRYSSPTPTSTVVDRRKISSISNPSVHTSSSSSGTKSSPSTTRSPIGLNRPQSDFFGSSFFTNTKKPITATRSTSPKPAAAPSYYQKKGGVGRSSRFSSPHITARTSSKATTTTTTENEFISRIGQKIGFRSSSRGDSGRSRRAGSQVGVVGIIPSIINGGHIMTASYQKHQQQVVATTKRREGWLEEELSRRHTLTDIDSVKTALSSAGDGGNEEPGAGNNKTAVDSYTATSRDQNITSTGASIPRHRSLLLKRHTGRRFRAWVKQRSFWKSSPDLVKIDI